MRRTLFAAAVLALAGPGARADVVTYEPFNYTPGTPLLGSNGGSGFASPWAAGGFNASIFTNYTVAAGSLPYPALATSGDRVTTSEQQAISGLTRSLATPLGTPGTTDYISVLLRPEGTVGAGALGGFFGLYLNASTTTPNLSQDLFLGKPGIFDQYDIEDRGGTNRHLSTVTATAGTTALLVLRMDFTAGIDKFTLYVNPTPGAPEPTAGVVKQDSDVGTIAALTLYSTGAHSLDEIRIGTTYADVVPLAAVPEPASLVSTLIGLTTLATWSRRGRSAGSAPGSRRSPTR
jgi:hypothetical protein